MTRRLKNLTNTQITSAKPKNKLYRLYDGGGLCLKVTVAGSKVWEYRFKNPDTNKDDTVIIGDYPLISLSEARDKHHELRRLVLEGISPKSSNANKSFQAVYNLWLERWKESVTKYEAKQKNALINRYCMKYLGHIDIDKIKPVNIVNALQMIENAGSLAQIPRAKSVLSMVFKFAASRGLCDSDPTSLVSSNTFKKHESKSHESLGLDKIYTIFRYFESGNAQPQTRRAVELALRNMARIQEVVMLKWEYINFDSMIMALPSELMKMKRPHYIPITPQTLKILEAQKNNTEFVFPSASAKKKHLNVQTPTSSLRRNGINSTSHGFRHLASTILNEARLEDGITRRFDETLIKRALSHKNGDVMSATYNLAEYLGPRKLLSQFYSDFIDKCNTKENNERALKEAGISLI